MGIFIIFHYIWFIFILYWRINLTWSIRVSKFATIRWFFHSFHLFCIYRAFMWRYKRRDFRLTFSYYRFLITLSSKTIVSIRVFFYSNWWSNCILELLLFFLCKVFPMGCLIDIWNEFLCNLLINWDYF